MTQPLDSHNTAIRLHQIMGRIVKREVKKTAPAPRYGVVTSVVDANSFTVQVAFGNETTSVAVTCSPWLTPTVGSYVRVTGTDADLVVSHILRGGREMVPLTYDTGWVTTGATAVNGASIVTQSMRKINNEVELFFTGTTGVQLSNATSGDYANANMIQLPSTFIPAYIKSLSSGANGPAFAFVITVAGIIQICAGPPATLAAGTNFSCGGRYFID